MELTNVQKQVLGSAIQELNAQQIKQGNPYFVLDLLLSPKEEQLNFLRLLLGNSIVTHQQGILQLESILRELASEISGRTEEAVVQ